MTPAEVADLTQGTDDVTPIVLAAGPGSRLWPLTNTRPKPMVEVAGQPILEWCLEALSDAGFEHATLVVGHKASTIQTHFGDGSAVDLDLTYVHQDQQIGTAHAVSAALEAHGMPASALILGGDNLIEPALIQDLLETGPDALAVTKSREPSKYGVVDSQGDRVTHITEKPLLEGEAVVSTGVCLLGRETLDLLSRRVKEGVTGLPSFLNELIDDGHRLTACRSSKAWLDAVHPWDLVSLTELLLARDGAALADPTDLADSAQIRGAVHVGGGSTLRPGALVDGPASLGANVRVGLKSAIARSLISDGASIGTGAIVESSVLAEGVSVGSGAVLGAGDAEIQAGDRVHPVRNIGAIVGEGSVIGPGAVLHPGTILGAGVRVAPGAVVRGRVPDGGWVQ